MRVNHNCVDCRLLPPSGGFQIHTFMLFGTCSLLSFPPSPLSSPSSLSRLEVYHLCKKNSSFRLTPGGTVIRMSALADGHLCGWRPAALTARSLGIPETPQIHAEVTPRLSRGHRRPPLRAFSHFRVGGGRFVNVDGPPCFGAGMNGRTEWRLSSNPFFHLISSPSEREAAPDVRVAVSNGDSHALIFIPARSSYLPWPP